MMNVHNMISLRLHALKTIASSRTKLGYANEVISFLFRTQRRSAVGLLAHMFQVN